MTAVTLHRADPAKDSGATRFSLTNCSPVIPATTPRLTVLSYPVCSSADDAVYRSFRAVRRFDHEDGVELR